MMADLNDKQIAEYLHRCYSAVDGLWFMKVEERFGFDTALEIDNEVWKVMAKIQSRKMKELLGKEEGLEALKECFLTKLRIDGCEVTSEETADGRGFRAIITKCPWHSYMVRSGRAQLSDKVGSRICNTEFSGWAAEFGDIEMKLESRICQGDKLCTMRFSQLS